MAKKHDDTDDFSPLNYALDMVAKTDGDGFTEAPESPTREMLIVGSQVGGVSPALAKLIYTSMLWAA